MSAEAAILPVQPLEQINSGYADAHRAEADTEASGWRARLSQLAGRAALALGIATGLVAAGATAEQTPAHAQPPDYGDWLSGQYAGDTRCAADAETLSIADITGIDYRWNAEVSKNNVGFSSRDAELKLGTIELRYSPACGTKWARMITTHNSDIDDVSVMQDTGYKQSRHVSAFWEGIPAAIATSPMIYSPHNAVHAYVEGDNLSQLSTDWR